MTAMRQSTQLVEDAKNESQGTTWVAGCYDLLGVVAGWTADETLWNSRRLDTDTVVHLRAIVQLTRMH